MGCIIEDDGKLLLLDTNEGVQLPTAAILGNKDDPNSLCGLLADLGVSTQENYLFAVFETRSENIMNIYYRAQFENMNPVKLSNRGQFIAFDQIPFDMLPDDATRNMLERYINERELDAFGIYVGDTDSCKDLI